MTDRSVSPHAEVWAQAFTAADGAGPVPRDSGKPARPAAPSRPQPAEPTQQHAAPEDRPAAPATPVSMELAEDFPPLPGEEPAALASTQDPADAASEDASAFDDLFEELGADLDPGPAAGQMTPPPTESQPAPFPAVPAPGSPTAAAKPAPPSHAPVQSTRDLSRRYAESSRLQPYITHLRNIIASDPELTDVVRDFTLTSDQDADTAQQRRLMEALSAYLGRASQDVTSKLPPSSQMGTVLEILYDDLVGIGPLGPLWRNVDVTEIIVRGPETVLVEYAGENLVRDVAAFRSLEHLQDTARQLAQQLSGRSLSPTNPLVTAELPGARVQFVYDPITRDGVFLAIRKFRPMLSMQALIDNKSLTEPMAAFLKDAVKARATICCSGGTGSGKTSMLNALSEFIDPVEHIVTIEDSYELRLTHPNVTSLQTKEKASADDTILIGQADLLVASLRMRPDRIIVGEIREGRGADTMMRAAGTGHDGSMTTIHANNPQSAVSDRLPDLLLEHKNVPMETARRSVANAIDVVVHVTKRAGRRFVSHIAVVDPTMVDGTGLHAANVFVYDGYSSTQVGGVDPASDLGVRMVEAGVGDTWFTGGASS